MRLETIVRPGRWLGLGTVAAVLAVAPNLLWLVRSTVRVENTGSDVVSGVVLEACSRARPLGPLEPGASVLRVLPRCGDDTLVLSTAAGESCGLYVEPGMYHVRASIATSGEPGCEYGGSPPFTPLLLIELIR